MSQYKDGTVSVTNGSNVVTGAGTLWLANISTGDLFTKAGDNVTYTVASIPSNTQITLTGNYGGSTSSGSSYGITIDFTPEGYPLLNDGDLNTGAIYNEALRLISNDKQALGTAAFADLTSPSATIFDDGNLNYTSFPSYKAPSVKVGTMYASSATSGVLELETNFKNTRASTLTVISSFKLTLAGTSASSPILTGLSEALNGFTFSGQRSDRFTLIVVNNLSGLTSGQPYTLFTETNTSGIDLA